MRRSGLRLASLGFVTLMLGAPGCESPFEVCNLMGCVNGLTVELDAMPAGEFTVEVFDVPDASPAYVYACRADGPPCTRSILFPAFNDEDPFVRVTTTLGTVTHHVTGIDYRRSRPNGPRCDPVCVTATVTVATPD